MTETATLTVQRLSTVVGGEITGVDLQRTVVKGTAPF